jgi:hypothetical protein
VTPSTLIAAEIVEILKVMTESLPIKLLSPLGPELMKLLQKKDQLSAAKERTEGQKKQRIVNVMEAIERTPPLASASKIVPIANAEATADAETSAEAVAAAEPANHESTLSGIDKLLLDMAAEETAVVAKKVMATVPDKGKRLLMLLQKKRTLTFGTCWVKNCPRLRRSYRNMGYPVATSQELCSLVELTKEP